MPEPIKYFLYVRRSMDEDDRQVYSIEHQLKELRRHATHKGLRVIAELKEERSAMTQGRPVFNDMLNRIKKGEASGILAWHPDRLSRNSFDEHQIKTLVETKVITHLEFAVYWFESTPQGNLMLDFAFGFAKYYSAALSQSIQRGIRLRIEDGYWPRQPPIGYRFDHHTRTVVLHARYGPLVKRMFELYSTGEYTLERLQQTINSAGLRTKKTKRYVGGPLTRSSYYHMLQNPFYAGMLKYKGQLYEAKHEPLVSNTLFDACQLILAKKGKYRTPKMKPFLYRGMFTCGECACAITMEIQKGHHYLRCTKSKGNCSQSYVRMEEVDEQVSRILRDISLPQDIIDADAAELESQQERELTGWNQEIKGLAAQVAQFDLKLKRLAEAYADGNLPVTNLNDSKEKYLKEKLKVVEKLKFAQSHRKTPLEPAIRFIRGLTKARIVAQGDDSSPKRDLFQKVASNLKIENKRVKWQARGPWKTVAETARFARRASRAANTSGAAHATFPMGCPPSSASRLPLECFSFFKDSPAWA